MAQVKDEKGKVKVTKSATTTKSTTTTKPATTTQPGTKDPTPTETTTTTSKPSTYYATMNTGGGTDVDNNSKSGKTTAEASTSKNNQGTGGFSGNASAITNAAGKVVSGTQVTSGTGSVSGTGSGSGSGSKKTTTTGSLANDSTSVKTEQLIQQSAKEANDAALKKKQQDEADRQAELARIFAENRKNALAAKEASNAAAVKKNVEADVSRRSTGTEEAGSSKVARQILLNNKVRNSAINKDTDEDPVYTGPTGYSPTMRTGETGDLGLQASPLSVASDNLTRQKEALLAPRTPVDNSFKPTDLTGETGDLGLQALRKWAPTSATGATAEAGSPQTTSPNNLLQNKELLIAPRTPVGSTPIGTQDPTLRVNQPLSAVEQAYIDSVSSKNLAKKQAESIQAKGWNPTDATGGGTELDNWSAGASTIHYYDQNGNLVDNPFNADGTLKEGVSKYFYSNPLPTVTTGGKQIQPGTTAEAKLMADTLYSRGLNPDGTAISPSQVTPGQTGTGTGTGAGGTGTGGSNETGTGGSIGNYDINTLIDTILNGNTLTLDDIINAYTGGRGVNGAIEDILASLDTADENSKTTARNNYQQMISGLSANAGAAANQIMTALAKALGTGYNDSAMQGAEMTSAMQGSLNPLTGLMEDNNTALQEYLANILSITEGSKKNRQSAEETVINGLANAATTAGYNYQGDTAALKNAIAAIVAEYMAT